MSEVDMNEVNEVAEKMEHFVNRFCFVSYGNLLVNKLSCMHRTLIQSFVGGFIMKYIKKMAENYDNGNYDARNSLACEYCKVMWDAVLKKNPHMEKYGTDLPCI